MQENGCNKTKQKKVIKSIFYRWGMPMRIILVKFTLYITEYDKKNPVNRFGSRQNNGKVKNISQNHATFNNFGVNF